MDRNSSSEYLSISLIALFTDKKLPVKSVMKIPSGLCVTNVLNFASLSDKAASVCLRAVISVKFSTRSFFPSKFIVVTVFRMGILFPSLLIRMRSELSTSCFRSVTGHFPFSAGQMNLWQ